MSLGWDFLGTGDFPTSEEVTGVVNAVQASQTYTEVGTYFPVARATAQREGYRGSAYARVQNLARVRVVVGDPPAF